MRKDTDTGDDPLAHWNGSQPYEHAAVSVYQLGPQARSELEAAFAQSGSPGVALPSEIWPELEAALSRHRTLIWEARWDKPPAETRAILAELEKRLKRDVEELEGLLMNDTSLSILGKDFEFWAKLQNTIQISLPMIASYRDKLKDSAASKGPDVKPFKYRRITTETVHKILTRYGLSLISRGKSTRKVYQDAFLSLFFRLAKDPIEERRAHRLIVEVVGQGQSAFQISD